MKPRKSPPRRRPDPVSEEDRRAFREAVADVTPRDPANRVDLAPPPPPPVPQQRLRDEVQVLQDALSDYIPFEEMENDEDLAYRRPGISSLTLKKMKQGQYVIQAELDLHGFNSQQAREHLLLFLAECKRRQYRYVRIIHGKGLGSRNREPVLKQKVRSWLMQREEVLAFCRPRAVEGGGGALLVLLKKLS